MRPVWPCLFAAALTVASWISVQAQPLSPAVEQGKRFLAAATSRDDASFLQAVRDLYPSSALTPEGWLEIRSNWKQFKFHGVEHVDATHAQLSVFDAGRDGWVSIVVSVDPSPSHALTQFSIRRGHRPADVPAPPRLETTALLAAAKAKVESEVGAGRFDGAVLIAQNRRVLWSAAYGLADRTAPKSNTVETQFRIGSMNKGFTEVAILQLAEAGKLDLKAPLSGYLPDFPNREAANRITIDELMTHSSGLGDFFGPEFEANRDKLRDPKDYIAMFGARPLLFEPGTRQDYSNFGYIVLGRVIEAVSGLSYDEYLQRHIYGPAGMTSTGARPETEAMPRRAVGYEAFEGGLRPATEFQVIRGTPAGGGYSTVGDLKAFADAFTAGRLLSAASMERLTTGGTVLPNGSKVQYDFGGRTGEGRRYYGHAGGSHGQSADLRIYADGGFVVVVLANRDPDIAAIIENYIGDRLP